MTLSVLMRMNRRRAAFMATPNKDSNIAATLERLRKELGADAFDIIDHWNSDRAAVGIASPRNHQVLVYISTAYDDGFYAELEIPPAPGGNSIYQVAGRYSGLTYNQLVDIVTEHLAVRVVERN